MQNKNYRKYQMERLNPIQIENILNERSLVYLPLGAIEWHGLHLPIGLDSLTSHGICLRSAQRTGGLVMPPLYYGMTGSIWHHPFTILIEEEDVFLKLLITTLQRLEASGVKKVILFTGHFARRQLETLQALCNRWSSIRQTLDIYVLSISACPNIEIEADHGALFETSVLGNLHPELLKLYNLPDKNKVPANDVDGNSKGDHRRDPNNVLFGIFGDDPRYYKDSQAKSITENLVEWLVSMAVSF